MFATTGIIQGNTVLTDDYSLEKYNGRKVIITVLEEDKPFETIADDKLFATSEAELIDFGLNIASGKMNKDDIKAWFLTHRK